MARRPNDPDCVHLGRPAGTAEAPGGRVPLFRCDHGAPCPRLTTPHHCLHVCDRRVPHPEPENEFPAPDSPACPLVTPDGQDAGLVNRFNGSAVFLVLAGPSLASYDLSRLSRRGVVTFAVNNAACVVRPHLWTFVDDPCKFHSAVWRDPGVLKLVPWGKIGRRRSKHLVWDKTPAGFRCTNRPPEAFPNVYGYLRNADFDPSRWLTEGTVNWGNDRRHAFGDDRKGVRANGWPHVLNVMLASLRLCHALGFRTVYLLGCDWNMTAHRPYAFRERKGSSPAEAVRIAAANNESYRKVGLMLEALKPVFDTAGYMVYNLNRRSGLRVFPFRDYDDAIEQATTCSGIPEHLDTEGWYGRQNAQEAPGRTIVPNRHHGRRRRRKSP